jgi:hypothetical protein
MLRGQQSENSVRGTEVRGYNTMIQLGFRTLIIAIVINMFRYAEQFATVKIPLSPFRKGGT